VADFIGSIESQDAQLIMDIIERISYSREKTFGDSDWLATLGETGIIVRNIVSDADKLEAIGEIGIRRCEQYSRHVSPHNVWARVRQHADEKLLHLRDHYIRTRAGKQLAAPLHDEMVTLLVRHSLIADSSVVHSVSE
jgi:HD superfamily phosphodiesterase